MPRHIGEIIKNLRKQQSLTQEQLAELLGVSGQAVSKWESQISAPDLSLIVPLASVFGVSTDILFDRASKSDAELARSIVAEASALNDGSVDGIYRALQKAREGLRLSPRSNTLLMYCLELGCCLAYPENDTFDELHANEIYRDAVRDASIVISHSDNTCDILRAHMIMVILHSAYGNPGLAHEHALAFPQRADMTANQMLAFIKHAQQDYLSESVCRQNDSFYQLEALIYSISANGCALMRLERQADAAVCFERALGLIDLLFADEPCPPPLYRQELGNLYLLLAEARLGLGDKDAAYRALEKAVKRELDFVYPKSIGSPLFAEVDAIPVYRAPRSIELRHSELRRELESPRFSELAHEERFAELLRQIK